MQSRRNIPQRKRDDTFFVMSKETKKMIDYKELKTVLKEEYQASFNRHRMNVKILLQNPTSIPEHTDFAAAVEEQLGQVAHYKDLLEAIDSV